MNPDNPNARAQAMKEEFLRGLKGEFQRGQEDGDEALLRIRAYREEALLRIRAYREDLNHYGLTPRELPYRVWIAAAPEWTS